MPPSNLAVQTRVAATTSNLGPGFDTLGIALQLYNLTRLTPNDVSDFRIVSPIASSNAEGARAMIEEAADLYFKTVCGERF